MAEIVRRKSWGGVLPLGRHASIRGSSFIQCASVSIALSSVQEGQTARHHKQFKLEQALIPIFVALTLLAIWFAEITTALLLLVVAMSIAGAVTLFILGSGYSVLW